MSEEARKLRIIAKLKKIDDDKLLSELEDLLDQSENEPAKARSLKDLAGIWTEEEAEKMKKDIEEACGQIHPDDWK